MPSKNTRKLFVPHSYYHVYNRGVNKQNIFEDFEDRDFLYHILSRYLDPNDTQLDFDKNPYRKYCDEVEMQCFCLMNNHYHFLLYLNKEPTGISQLMQNVWTSYTKYFNKKHGRVGPMFQDRFKASLITSDEHLLHITRYIHLNPSDYMNYQFSSLSAYTGNNHLGWLNPDRMLEIIDGTNYLEFLKSA